MSSLDMIEDSFYLTIQPKDVRHPYKGINIPKVTKGKPSIPKGAIAMKLELKVPRSLFTEFIPSGTITLPEDASIGRPAVEVCVPDDLEVRPDMKLALVPWPEEDK